MVNGAFAIPALAAVAVALVMSKAVRPTMPAVVTWMITVLAVAAASATVWLLSAIAIGFAAHQLGLTPLAVWCRSLSGHHEPVPWFVGVLAWLGLAYMAVAVWQCERRRRRDLRGIGDDLADDRRPLAFAVSAGGSERIVVSAGMVEALEPIDLRVVLAHERAHLRHRHHRFLHAVEVASCIVPLLAPARAAVRFATERWADEEAAAEVGDRRQVAVAIARAALAVHDFRPALAFTGGSTTARVQALVDPPRPRRSLGHIMVAATVVGLVPATVQFHHMALVLEHLC